MTRKVLVIDDDDVARTVIGAQLERAGFGVHTMASPIGATRAIRDHAIDVVLCDLNMPAMRGDAFARLFRQSSALRDVPLVVISGAPRSELAGLMDEGTVDAVIHKSDVERALVSLLSNVARKRAK